MIAAKEITAGSWSARWHNHVIHLREQDGWWSVIVWSWPPGRSLAGRVLLDQFDGFVNAQVAISWACDILIAHGASVLINGKKRDLSEMLAFTPAPELVA